MHVLHIPDPNINLPSHSAVSLIACHSVFLSSLISIPISQTLWPLRHCWTPSNGYKADPELPLPPTREWWPSEPGCLPVALCQIGSLLRSGRSPGGCLFLPGLLSPPYSTPHSSAMIWTDRKGFNPTQTKYQHHQSLTWHN